VFSVASSCGTNPSVQLNGARLPEVVPASPQNSFTTYVQISDDAASIPPPSPTHQPARRQFRTVLKSLSVDGEEAAPKSPTLNPNGTNSVRFALPDVENIPQRTDTVANKMSEDYERPSRLRRFADRFTRKNRRDGPRRRQSLPSKRLDSLTTSLFCIICGCVFKQFFDSGNIRNTRNFQALPHLPRPIPLLI
jgi:hypothetical protein